MNPQDWLNVEFLGNSLLYWSIGAGIFVVAALILLTARRILRKSLQRLAKIDGAEKLDVAAQIVSSTRGWFILMISLFIGSRLVSLPDSAATIWKHIVVIGLLIQLGTWAAAGLGKSIAIRREEKFSEDPGSIAAMDMMHFVLRVAIWTFVLLLALDNIGVNITALVAGMGVGGIAVALAAQNIIGDLFSSLSIVLDKPFIVGDFLIIGEFLGSVEKVGLKTTRIRSLSGEQLIFSNTDLLNSRIRNYGRLFERRVVFSIGVTYQTPAAVLKTIPGIIRDAVEAEEDTRFDRSHFQKYGDFALTFETVYFVLSPDYNRYMDIQQGINLAIFERFEQEGIEFAYPTQTVYLGKPSSGDSPQPD
jgi:small-conductance mechanosensitive channel